MAGLEQDCVKRIVGYDCVFVESLPEKFIQPECPVCLHIIREPHQVSCCGNKFCEACIMRIKDRNKACPLCNEGEFTSHQDKQLKRLLNDQKVHCSHQKRGCEWTGKLGQLDDHLSSQSETGCPFSTIACIDCGHPIERQNMQHHQIQECSYRPYSCEHCHDYESTYNEVISKHWPECRFFPVPCPNKCSSISVQRQNLEKHIIIDCPMRLIHCELHLIGCPEKLPLKDMADHHQKNLSLHFSLIATSYATQQEKMSKLENENRLLKMTLEPLLQARPLSPLAMTQFEYHKKKGDWWYSPPVYTHPQGYKVCLGVFSSSLRYISVYVVFMKGEFDDSLKWPFRGTISYQLLDQVNGKKHKKGHSIYNDKVEDKFCSKVTKEIRSKYGHGQSKFIAHNELEPTYLQNDMLLFEIENTSSEI